MLRALPWVSITFSVSVSLRRAATFFGSEKDAPQYLTMISCHEAVPFDGYD